MPILRSGPTGRSGFNSGIRTLTPTPVQESVRVGLVEEVSTGSPYTLQVDTAAVTLTGTSVTLKADRKLTVTTQAVTLTGSSVSLKIARKIAVTTAAVTATGTSVSLRAARRITVSTAAITATGSSVSLRRGYPLSVTTAAVTTSGTSAALRIARKLTVTSSAVTSTGSSVSLRTTRRIIVTSSPVTLSGTSVSLTYGGGSSFPTQYAGLRYFDNGTVQDLCLVDVADAPTGDTPIIDKNGTLYAVYLVATSDPDASTIRVHTNDGTKAIRLKT